MKKQPSRLFTDAECVAIVKSASGRKQCPPPVENSEPRSVTVPGKDGQGADTPKQLTLPL